MMLSPLKQTEPLPNDPNQLILKLLLLSADQLLALMTEQPEIKKFCQENSDFQAAIKHKLEPHYIATEIVSQDKKKKLTLLNLFLATKFYTEAIALPETCVSTKITLLKQARKLGSFNASTMLCASLMDCIDLKMINNDNDKKLFEDRFENIVQEIIDICQSLKNLFWSAGLVISAIYHLLIGDVIKKFYSEKPCYSFFLESVNQSPFFYEQATKDLISAQLLMQQEISKKIVDQMTGGKGLLALFPAGKMPVDSWNTVNTLLRNKVGSRKFDELEKEVLRELSQPNHKCKSSTFPL